MVLEVPFGGPSTPFSLRTSCTADTLAQLIAELTSDKLQTGMPNSDLQAKIIDWCQLWEVPGLVDRVQVVFSRRLRSSLGRCTPATGSIRLHAGLEHAAPALQSEVLCHELAHLAAYELHEGNGRPHGQEWAELMRRAGYEPRVRHTATSGEVPGLSRQRRRRRRVHHEPDYLVFQLSRIAKRVMRQWRRPGS